MHANAMIHERHFITGVAVYSVLISCVYNQPIRRVLLRPSFSFAVPVPCLLCAMHGQWWPCSTSSLDPRKLMQQTGQQVVMACMQATAARPAFNLYQLQQAFCRGSPPRGYYALEGGHAWPSTVSCLVNFFWWFV